MQEIKQTAIEVAVRLGAKSAAEAVEAAKKIEDAVAGDYAASAFAIENALRIAVGAITRGATVTIDAFISEVCAIEAYVFDKPGAETPAAVSVPESSQVPA